MLKLVDRPVPPPPTVPHGPRASIPGTTSRSPTPVSRSTTPSRNGTDVGPINENGNAHEHLSDDRRKSFTSASVEVPSEVRQLIHRVYKHEFAQTQSHIEELTERLRVAESNAAIERKTV